MTDTLRMDAVKLCGHAQQTQGFRDCTKMPAHSARPANIMTRAYIGVTEG